MSAGAGGRARPVAWGAAVAALYLVAAVASVATGLVRGRPLYDGLPRQPYRWVTPPAERAKDNKAPAGGEATVRLTEGGILDPQSVSTGDLQAHVIFEKVDPAEFTPGGPADVKVKVTPLDPLSVGAKPSGRFFDSNAYRIEAAYPSGKPVEACECDIILTYAVHSTDVRRWDGNTWVELERPSADRGALQIYSFSEALGTFVATGAGDVPTEPDPADAPPRPAMIFIGVALVATAVVGFLIFAGRKKAPPAPKRKR